MQELSNKYRIYWKKLQENTLELSKSAHGDILIEWGNRMVISADYLRNKIIKSLQQQGFCIQDGNITLPENVSKKDIRALHQLSTASKILHVSPKLKKKESILLSYFAFGTEITPSRISPRLRLVKSGSLDELLFRYACLHWSIPVSSGYGRRLRFLVFDDYNGKLIGLFGLGDPVFSLKARDQWVGWGVDERKKRLKYVVDAFVLGAVPPYNYLLGGKLIAMLAASNEVQAAFREKYQDKQSVISGNVHDGKLAMLTTTSALGRSSIYNRLKYRNRLLYKSVGFTVGSGDFHFANGIYEELVEFAKWHCKPTAKKDQWGKGFRNRREVIRKVLSELGLSWKLAFHQVRREIFVIPLARNAQAFLQGVDSDLLHYEHPADDMFEWFRKRWLLPRAEREQRYRSFNPENLRLWKE